MPNPKPKKRLSPYLVPFTRPRTPERAAADVSAVTPHDPESPTLREVAGALGLGLGKWFYRAAGMPIEGAREFARVPTPLAPVFAAIGATSIPERASEFRGGQEAELEEVYGSPTSTEARAAELIGMLIPDLLPVPGLRGAMAPGVAREIGSPAVRAARASLRAERAIPAPNLPDVATLFRSGYGVSESPFFSMLRRPGSQALRDAVRANLDAPGFTIDAAGKPFEGSGYVVALGKEFTSPLRSVSDVDKFLARPDVQARLEQPGYYVGGWRDPATGQGEINITRRFDDQRAAVGAARRYKEKAFGEFKDSEYVGDRDYIASPAVRGADGKVYTGANHGDAEDAAVDALRSTSEGRAAIERNGGNAVIRDSHGFTTGRSPDDIVTRDQAREIVRGSGQAPRLAPEYTQLHSSDIGPPKGLDEPPATAASPAPAPEPPRAPPTLMSSPKGRALSDALLQDETARLTKRNIPQFEAAARTLPSTEAFGAGALAGAPKLGWYENSARALTEAYGPDAPRFAALLSALSPQQGVSANLAMAMDTWEVWNAAGRPTGRTEITRLMNDVAKRNPGGKQMGSRAPNAIDALTSADPAELALSGPKVFSFHRNLIGETQRVTLDTWMAKLGGQKPSAFGKGGGRHPGVEGMNPLYLAYSGRVRETADELSRATGRRWTPAEVQETLWSWGKALTETAEPMARGVHPSLFEAAGIAPQGMRDLATSLPRETIAGVPDFASLLRQEPYAGSLARQGLRAPSPTRPTPFAGPAPDPFSLDELVRNLERTIRR